MIYKPLTKTTIRNKKLKLALSELEKEMEILSKEEMFLLKGGATEDIVVLLDSAAANGFGHIAVLIGNEERGWYYYSVNGTGDDKGRLWGDNVNPNIGTPFRGSVEEAKRHFGAGEYINGTLTNKHNYDQHLRIFTTPSEDELAMEAAAGQAGTPSYNVWNSSCLSVVEEAINAVRRARGASEIENFYRPDHYFDYLSENGFAS